MPSDPDIIPFGHPQLDRARGALARLADRLAQCRRVGGASEEISDLLSRFVSEAYRYITLEETWLKDAGYPALEAHLLEHQRIIEMLAQASMDVMRARPDAVERLCESLEAHFIEHIRGRDGQIARFVASHPETVKTRG
ncbi:MAG: hemerythrin family protein [Rhodocyclaceae bacterium]|nr:hemerythrin family protein [Rhodocyclaceae bacterium]